MNLLRPLCNADTGTESNECEVATVEGEGPGLEVTDEEVGNDEIEEVEALLQSSFSKLPAKKEKPRSRLRLGGTRKEKSVVSDTFEKPKVGSDCPSPRRLGNKKLVMKTPEKSGETNDPKARRAPRTPQTPRTPRQPALKTPEKFHEIKDPKERAAAINKFRSSVPGFKFRGYEQDESDEEVLPVSKRLSKQPSAELPLKESVKHRYSNLCSLFFCFL